MSKQKRMTEIDKLSNKAYKKFIFRSKSYIKRIGGKLHRNKISKEEKLTHTLAILFLNKNLVTSKTIKMLISKGQLDEALILMRVIIERSALVYKALQDNLVVEDIEKLYPPNCIKYLKRHFDIGKLYGFFSDLIHSKTLPSLLFAIVGGRNIKSERMDEIKLLFKMYLIFVVEVNFAVIEFLAKNYLKIKSRWKLKGKFWIYLPVTESRFITMYDGLMTLYSFLDKNTRKRG